MPTYHAIGVTASLATCDLRSTLTKEILRTMGPDCKKEFERVEEIFSNAHKLPERVVGAGGSEEGVLQFVGVDEDLPLYVVEAGEKVGRKGADGEQDEEMEDVVAPKHLSTSNDSPLTSLGETPSLANPSNDGGSPDGKRASPVKPPPIDMGKSLTARLASLASTAEQSLVLDIELTQNSFLPDVIGDRVIKNSCKDLKIEVFLNGEFVDLAHIPGRNAPATMLDKKVRFSGTRVHRQVEKPWVYASSAAGSDARVQTAQGRWRTISNMLAEEAERRGRDRLGDMPPSAELLSALAIADLPERLEGQAGLGVIDIIITAGKGQKYGCETTYIMGPTRLDDSEYTVSGPALPRNTETASTFGTLPSITSLLAEQTLEAYLQQQQSSPEIPLRQAHKLALGSPTPPKKTAKDLAVDLGIDIDPVSIKLDSYEKSSGKSGRGSRTLMQRLGDIGKMSPHNQAREMEKLRTELGDMQDSKRIKKKMKLDHVVDTNAPSPSPPKLTINGDPFVDSDGIEVSNNGRRRLRFTNAPTSIATSPLATAEAGTMSPTDMFKQWPPHLPAPSALSAFPPPSTDPEAVLTQTRIDMALAAGAESNSHLLRHIASTSPMRTPPKKTKASALANSPTRVLVKPQTKSGPPKTPTTRRTHTALNGSGEFYLGPSPVASIPKLARSDSKLGVAANTPSRSGAGANRTADKWDPKEATIEEALAHFRPKEVFEESCVGYAGDEKAKRQIGKARAGRFREEGVVVGMRFIVV